MSLTRNKRKLITEILSNKLRKSGNIALGRLQIVLDLLRYVALGCTCDSVPLESQHLSTVTAFLVEHV